jgi:hypothetical protein
MEALMSMNNESKGPVAVLLLPEQNKSLITFARAVHDALLNNPGFPNPNPTLVMFAGAIAEFEDAETKTASRAKGAAQLRDVKKKTVKDCLFHLRDYVQSVVETNTSPVAATALIKSAFMSVRKAPKRTLPELSAKNTGVSGTVVLDAKAVAPVATYYWQYSLDQETWTSVPEAMQAKRVISGLTSLETYHFRFRALTRGGEIGFSQVVSLLVL